MVDEALGEMNARFDEIYPQDGRRSIPERLLRALLLQMLCSIRSERMLMEQLEYNLLFRWFVGLSANEPVWHPAVFTRNRDRLLKGAVSEQFYSLIVTQARRKKLLSDEHFTVDGTLVEAWAGQKSFQRKDRDNDPLSPPPDRSSNPTINWHREKRSNETHQSLTDAMAPLYKKTRGAEAKLGYLGHVLTENRNGLVVDVRLTQASGTAERDAAEAMISGKAHWRSVTLGAVIAATTHAASLHRWGNSRSRPTWRRTIRTGETPSTDAPRSMTVMRSVSASVSAWKKSSAGSRPSRCGGRHASAGWSESAGCSRWPLPLTTSCVCAIFSRQPHREKCVC